MRVRTEQKAGRRQWFGLAVLLPPTMLLTADLGVLWPATPFVTADLRPPSAEFLWIIDIYGFMTAGYLLALAATGPRIPSERGRTMENALYAYDPIVDRPPIRWPGDARVAFYVGLNVEHFLFGRPSTSLNEATSALVPDPLNHGWRDYGPRVGFWRVTECLDRHGVRASVLLNSSVCDHYPQIIQAGTARDWAWVAHGRTNSVLPSGMSEDEERAELAAMVATIEKATGRRPRGWMGPALNETLRTPALLAELGLSYVLDWTCDDQPFRLNVPGMLSVPYSVEVNDLGLFTAHGMTGPDFLQLVKDQFDQLYADSATSGRVMALALHPFVIGQAFRAKYLDQALAYIAGHPGVWLTTSDEIAAHYASGAS
ncbi:polysaccharide deacetylase family protein [Nonomuraea sp. NPDC047529]|uniref:polysaccharide deacetylase family protein n=1 Tax=Nonomuraea sp. NPDC047529 TaxID=3155623 RepID=UPI0033FC539B